MFAKLRNIQKFKFKSRGKCTTYICNKYAKIGIKIVIFKNISYW